MLQSHLILVQLTKKLATPHLASEWRSGSVEGP